jgi:hypothetical protein
MVYSKEKKLKIITEIKTVRLCCRSEHAAVYRYLTCQECKEPCGSVKELREHTTGLHFAPQGSTHDAQHCLQIVIEDSLGGLLPGVSQPGVTTTSPGGDDDDTENCSNNKKYTCKSCIFVGNIELV